MLAAREHEEGADSVGARGYVTVPKCTLLVTLCRFDHIYLETSKPGPFIPCERRLALLGILEIQGRGFRAPF